MQNDIGIIFNTEVELHLPTSGHYCIEIFQMNNILCQEKFYLEKNLSKKQKEKQILNTYKQFGHSSSSSVSNTGALNSEISKKLSMLYQNVMFVLNMENHHPVSLLVMPKQLPLTEQSLWICTNCSQIFGSCILLTSFQALVMQ